MLQHLLHIKQIAMQPVVMGEIGLGQWPHRAATLYGFRRMPQAQIARDHEVLRLIEDLALAGTGLGYMDAHLIASVVLMPETQLWTWDKSLHKIARQLSLAADLV
jgi:hypothetical protein